MTEEKKKKKPGEDPKTGLKRKKKRDKMKQNK